MEEKTTDPTALTTQLMVREVLHLKELLQTRVTALEKSIDLAHQDMVRVPTDVQKQVGNLRELHEQKISEINAVIVQNRIVFDRYLDNADLRYLQRFEAQERALEIALTTVNRAMDLAIARVDKEFHEHLTQVREETRVAFMNSERAITKAEIANEKRFEGINEFRGQLSDQAASFMSRTESLSLHHSTGEKIDALTTRLDRQEGRGSGLNQGWIYLLGGLGLIGTLVGIFSTLITLFLLLRK